MRKTHYGIAVLCTAVLAMNAGNLKGQGSPRITLLQEFRPIGGSGNNLQNPNLDPVPGAPEIALAPLNFAGPNDGLITGPNPRTISNAISGGTGANGQNAETTDPTLSAWLYVFGQFIDHDLDLEYTPLTTGDISIAVPKKDPVFPPNTVIQMTRDVRNPKTNTIINTTAGYLDLSQLYGSDEVTAASLRNSDGTLKTSDGGQALPAVNDQFVTGDPRVMENPELSAITILFMREHNFWVSQLKARNPTWTGDQLYNMAKAITTAEYQNIVYQEFVPALIGPVLGQYTGYNPTVNAQVSQEFSTAAFRVGHSQVSGTQEGIDVNGKTTFTQSLAVAFTNTPEIDEENGINDLLRALGTDFSQATDVYAVPELRNLLIAGLVGGEVDKLDLIAIDIQRERDVGLASLNQTRVALGMRPYGSFADLTSDRVLQATFQTVYGSIDQVDLFMGGLAEAHAPGAAVGPTFQAILAKQFEALRVGDRFFWARQEFDSGTALMIASTRLSDLIKRDAATPNVQKSVFIQANLPLTSPKPRLPLPFPINGHGHKVPFFNDDGV